MLTTCINKLLFFTNLRITAVKVFTYEASQYNLHYFILCFKVYTEQGSCENCENALTTTDRSSGLSRLLMRLPHEATTANKFMFFHSKYMHIFVVMPIIFDEQE